MAARDSNQSGDGWEAGQHCHCIIIAVDFTRGAETSGPMCLALHWARPASSHPLSHHVRPKVPKMGFLLLYLPSAQAVFSLSPFKDKAAVGYSIRNFSKSL